MKQKFVKKMKKRLERQKRALEKTLKRFAKKDPELKGDWDTFYPKWNGASGGSGLEIEADEFQEYETKREVEHALELKLQDVNGALEKIKQGQYGICEECGKEISKPRLKIVPQAKLCRECKS